MTPEQARKFVRSYIRQQYGPYKALAAARGCSISAVGKAVKNMSGWLLQEAGIRKVEAFEEVKPVDSNCAQTPTIRP